MSLKDFWNDIVLGKNDLDASEMSFFISFADLKKKFGLRGEVSNIDVDKQDKKLKVTTKIK